MNFTTRKKEIPPTATRAPKFTPNSSSTLVKDKYIHLVVQLATSESSTIHYSRSLLRYYLQILPLPFNFFITFFNLVSTATYKLLFGTNKSSIRSPCPEFPHHLPKTTLLYNPRCDPQNSQWEGSEGNRVELDCEVMGGERLEMRH